MTRTGATVEPALPVAARWRLDQWPARERPEAWREAITRTHLEWCVDVDRDLPDAVPGADPAITVRRVDDLALVDCTTGPCSGRRGRGELRRTDGEFLGVLLVLAGREHIELDGRQAILDAGEMLVWDSTRPVRFAVPGRLVKRTLLVPRARVGALLPRVEPAVVAPGPATRLLAGHLAALSALDGPIAGPAAAAAAGAALELLAAALHPGPQTPGRWERVRAYVERHLADPDLCPQRIAAAHALSLRALYLLFEQRDETVSGYVRRRRLVHARAELARLGSGTTVAEVAHRWGFADQSGFARAFRRQYGCAPNDVRLGRGSP